MTDSMRRAIDETDRRRSKQEHYNEEHGIEPRTVIRSINDSLASPSKPTTPTSPKTPPTSPPFDFANQQELDAYIAKLVTEMREAGKKFEFERPATLRDQVKELRTKEFLFG